MRIFWLTLLLIDYLWPLCFLYVEERNRNALTHVRNGLTESNLVFCLPPFT